MGFLFFAAAAATAGYAVKESYSPLVPVAFLLFGLLSWIVIDGIYTIVALMNDLEVVTVDE